MKSQRKEKFQYPHPILKSFNSIAQQSQTNQPFAYQSFHTSDPNSISYKILRSTHIQPLMGSSFSLLLQPLHPKVEINNYENKDVLVCKKCKSVLNTTSMIKLSLFQHKCKFCGLVDQSQFGSGRFVDMNLFDKLKIQTPIPQKQRKFLFAIQANQLLYDKLISVSIFNCLKALAYANNSNQKLNKSISEGTDISTHGQDHISQEEEEEPSAQNNTNLKVGFMFFDNQRVYLLNLTNNQVVIAQPECFTEQPPLSQGEMFQPLHSIDLQAVQDIVSQIMYSAYQLKLSCLVDTLKICNWIAEKWQAEPKLFTCSYDKNVAKQKEKKNSKSNQSQKLITINPRVQIYLMESILYGYLCGLGLADNISKSYQYNYIDQTALYYDLYHNLTQQTYYNVEFNISSSQLITCNKAKFTFPMLTSNIPIIIDLHIPINPKTKHFSTLEQQELLSSQAVQIRIKLDETERVITYSVPKISSNLLNQPYLLNDETFFYVMMSKFLMDKNSPSLKKAIGSKAKQIVDRILKIEDQSFGIPKNLTNFFMYSFLMMQQDMYEKRSSNFLHERAKFLRQGLQTVVKKIYPKAYQFYSELLPLKFRPKAFLNDTIRLVDNGLFLGIVLGEEVNQKTLIQLFNTKDLNIIVELTEIPILNNPLNQRLHSAIERLRELNQLYYLPIKVIELCSVQYEIYYGNQLYIEEQHRKFFSDCLKN